MLHHRFYWAIITLEAIYTLSCLMGTYQLYRKLDAPRNDFHEAKKFAIVGFVTAIFVYYVFISHRHRMVRHGYSAKRNAFDWARHNIEFMFLGLIYLTLKMTADNTLCAQASFPATGLALALGLRNTSTLPSITITRPTSAGAVHW